jgi:hypothetical protein
MKRNPHPARRARIATLGISTTAFVSVVTSFAWNTHQAELAASTVDVTALPAGQTLTSSSSTASVAVNAATPSTPPAVIAPTSPAQNGSSSAPAKPKVPAAPKVTPATPVAPAAPNTAAVAPAAPTATFVYTCMSPGGKTENPTATGTCKNAQYGYVLTQV